MRGLHPKGNRTMLRKDHTVHLRHILELCVDWLVDFIRNRQFDVSFLILHLSIGFSRHLEAILDESYLSQSLVTFFARRRQS
jgi:hypothetical protein